MDLMKMGREELVSLQSQLRKEYEGFQAMGLKLDMSRGKPGPEQLDLSEGILTVLNSNSQIKSEGVDVRNYGGLEGLKACRQLFAELLGVSVDNIIAGGNSSLTMMYDTMTVSYTHLLSASTSAAARPKLSGCKTVPSFHPNAP